MLDDPDLQPFACAASHPAPHGRRLQDRIMVAFHQACDRSELELANSLITLIEKILWQDRAWIDRRRRLDNLVAAYERLWFLRHAGQDSMADFAPEAANG